MIDTHLGNADAKWNDFVAELTKADYFPEKGDEYNKAMELAKKTFIEKTTIALSTQYKDLGNEKLMANESDLAKKLYTESIRLFPTAVAYTNRGKAYDKVTDYASAQEDYIRAIKLDSNYAKSYNALISLLMKTKKIDQAKEYLELMKTTVKDKKSIEEAEKAISK